MGAAIAAVLPLPDESKPLSLEDLNTTVNGQPRIKDLRLAEFLGFSDPHMIRRLIDRHMSALKGMGEVSVTVTETGKKGGRPGKTYWLTEHGILQGKHPLQAGCADDPQSVAPECARP